MSRRGKIHYAEEKQALAEKYGYPNYDTAIVSMYAENTSTNVIAGMFGVSRFSIQYRLKRINGVTMRPRGGKNNVKKRSTEN